jgi:ABC-2 type transport system ATP-binding protein
VTYTAHQQTQAIVVEGLTKSYHGELVLDHIAMTVYNAEIFALLGPNGAGKTTAVEILEGYRTSDEGMVRVFGWDPIRDGARLKARMGVMLQDDGVYPGLTPRELLRLFSSFYPEPRSIADLLELTGLTPSAHVRSRRLSGGQKRRLALALAMVGRPDVLFLDEPTTGMDPQARLATWRLIQEERKRGATVVLTTQSMEEAERLADRVAIINHGSIVALDRPRELTMLQTNGVVRLTVQTPI